MCFWEWLERLKSLTIVIFTKTLTLLVLFFFSEFDLVDYLIMGNSSTMCNRVLF